MTVTLEDAKRALERAKDIQYAHECGNDMYYSSKQYQEDKEDIEYWENKVKELERFTKRKDWKQFRANVNKKG